MSTLTLTKKSVSWKGLIDMKDVKNYSEEILLENFKGYVSFDLDSIIWHKMRVMYNNFSNEETPETSFEEIWNTLSHKIYEEIKEEIEFLRENENIRYHLIFGIDDLQTNDIKRIRNENRQERKKEKEALLKENPTEQKYIAAVYFENRDNMRDQIKKWIRRDRFSYQEYGDPDPICAYISRQEDHYVYSKDKDLVLFGGDKIVDEFLLHEKGLRVFSWNSYLRNKKLDYETVRRIAIVCGTDYNNGVPQYGIQKSSKLALDLDHQKMEIEKFVNVFSDETISKDLINAYRFFTNIDKTIIDCPHNDFTARDEILNID